MRHFLFLLCLLGPVAEAHEQILSSYRWQTPETQNLKEVARLFEIVKRNGQEYEVLVPADQAALFEALAPRATLLEKDTSAALLRQLQEYTFLRSLEGYRYHSFQEIQDWMQELKKSEIVQLIPYGTSQQGRPLTAIRLTKGEGEKPALLFTAATHGDELITTEVLMHLVNELVAGYGNNPRLTGLVTNYDLYFIPVINPDGFVKVQRYDNGRDPNRSYPYPQKTDAQPTTSIQALIQFFHSRTFAGSIDFHAYGELIMYPWAYTHDPVDPVSAQKFRELTSHMANSNGYEYGPISDIIYVAPGSSADYYFWKTNSLSLGIEIGRTKAPPPNYFPDYMASQVESTWRFIEGF